MFRFQPVDPIIFRVRDIVEVQMTIVTIPVKKGRFKMLTQLRSIALINSAFTEVSMPPEHDINT